MAKFRPMTRDEIEEKEALHIALTKWFNTEVSMEMLDEAHERNFGHSFNPYETPSTQRQNEQNTFIEQEDR